MQLVQWSDYWENEGPRIVRCEGEVAWKRVSGNELCREREGGEGAWALKSLQMAAAAMKLKDICPLEEEL